MASKALLNSLNFRSAGLVFTLPDVTRITVRYGVDISTCAGHTSARKFARNFLPVLLYNNPGVECAIQRSAEHNERPGVVVLHSDGREQVYDTRSMAVEFPKRVDREVFRQLATAAAAADSSRGSAAAAAAELLAASAPPSRGAGNPSRKSRLEKAAVKAATAAAAAPAAEPAGAAAAPAAAALGGSAGGEAGGARKKRGAALA